MNNERNLLFVKIIMTITTGEFFGPVLRDIGSSHLQNPDWVGHARFHLAWALALMASLGILNLYLIWVDSKKHTGALYLSFLLQAFNIGGFWIAAIFSNAYNGNIVIANGDHHISIMGLNENVFVFIVLAVILLANFLYFHFGWARPHRLSSSIAGNAA